MNKLNLLIIINIINDKKFTAFGGINLGKRITF